MIKKIINLIKENRELQKKQILMLAEIEWANIYHDSIRGRPWLEDLSLNIGRWAGNYTFFYLLNRILHDCKPKSILEMGLGESSKFVSRYLDFYLKDSTHLILEQDINWLNNFNQNFQLSKRSNVQICEITKMNIKGFEVNSYSNLELKVNSSFDLYIVDGPLGSPRYSRFDIVTVARKINKKDEFIIILDDFDRPGEKDTFKELESVLKDNGIVFYHSTYYGRSLVKVITSEAYKYCCSI
jgi:hypothetical protein